MAKTTLINGIPCRWYFAGSIYIDRSGCYAFSNMKGKVSPLQIYYDDGNEKYVIHPFGYTVSIPKAVLTCYCPPRPDDGKIYMINYRDGNNMNCDCSNLEWTEYHYQYNLNDSCKLTIKKGNSLTVFKDGTVKYKGKKLSIERYMYDSDTDLHVVIDPLVRTSSERYDVEDLMAKAGYIQGDNAGMKVPRVLHKDKNWLNFSSDNLEWIEAADPRYIEYYNHRVDDMNTLMIDLNHEIGHKETPDFMLIRKIDDTQIRFI